MRVSFLYTEKNGPSETLIGGGFPPQRWFSQPLVFVRLHSGVEVRVLFSDRMDKNFLYKSIELIVH